MNGVLRLIPGSRRPPENNEHHAEWSAGRALSNALKQALQGGRASLFMRSSWSRWNVPCSPFSEERLPKAIVNPIDLRRGRFAALKSDMVFYGGGNIKVRTGQSPGVGFWARARTVHEEIRKQVEQEIRDLPSRLHFLRKASPAIERTDPVDCAAGRCIEVQRRWNRFGLSKLEPVRALQSR